jgi:hypothetical protein
MVAKKKKKPVKAPKKKGKKPVKKAKKKVAVETLEKIEDTKGYGGDVMIKGL